ncbi:MAG: hypothetical protein WC421_10975 [Elusimicrobiales bacterium]
MRILAAVLFVVLSSPGLRAQQPPAPSYQPASAQSQAQYTYQEDGPVLPNDNVKPRLLGGMDIQQRVPQDSIVAFFQEIDKTGETVAAISALAANKDFVPRLELMNAIYNFRQLARDVFNYKLKDRGLLDFRQNADMLSKDFDVLRKNAQRVEDSKYRALITAMFALRNAPRNDAMAASYGTRARDLFRARAESAQQALSLARQKLAYSSGKTAAAIRENITELTVSLVRTAVEAFKEDRGFYPSSLTSLSPDYLGELPALEIPGHKLSAAVRVITQDNYANPADAVTETGGWVYNANTKSVLMGTVFIDSAKRAASGKQWCDF